MNTSNIFKITMHKGLIVGLIFTANFLMSASQNVILMLLTYPVIIGILYLTYRFTKTFRDEEHAGFISFSRIVGFVVLLFFFGSIISGILKLVYVQFVNPDYLPLMLEQALVQLERTRPLLERLNLPMNEAYYEQLERQFKPANFVLQMIWMNVFWGIITGTILGLALRKKPGLFDQKNETDRSDNNQTTN